MRSNQPSCSVALKIPMITPKIVAAIMATVANTMVGIKASDNISETGRYFDRNGADMVFLVAMVELPIFQ